jgi:hypothetical protein
MALSANALAKKLGCAWRTVRRALLRGILVGYRQDGRWAIDEGSIAAFQQRLQRLAALRQKRASQMKGLWQSGKLRARRRRMGQPERIVVLRPKALAAERVQSPVFLRNEREAEGYCPHCHAHLRVLMG